MAHLRDEKIPDDLLYICPYIDQNMAKSKQCRKGNSYKKNTLFMHCALKFFKGAGRGRGVGRAVDSGGEEHASTPTTLLTHYRHYWLLTYRRLLATVQNLIGDGQIICVSTNSTKDPTWMSICPIHYWLWTYRRLVLIQVYSTLLKTRLQTSHLRKKKKSLKRNKSECDGL